LLKDANLGYVGGAEVEQVSLGKELSSLGQNVCFITYYYGHKQTENIHGISVVKAYSRAEVRKSNSFSKIKSIWHCLKKVNADIYFHEAGAIGFLPIFSDIRRKKFVHRIASDAVVLSKSLSGRHSFSENLITAFEIKKADAVIAQSEFQKRLLENRFKVESVVIKNGMPITQNPCEKSVPPVVLWVGSITKVKNPTLFVQLAKSLPNFHFEMVGGRTDDSELYENVTKAGEKLTNFKFHGFVPYPEINDYFKRASIFVNTSKIEGFPNTFIQAWAHFCPIVSLHADPDGIIQNEHIGFHSGTFKKLILDVTTLLEDENLRKTMGRDGRNYVEEKHDIRKIVKQYIKTFNAIL